MRLIALTAFVILCALPGAARGGDVTLPEGHRVYGYLGAFGSLANDMPAHSNNAVGFGWSARVGWRAQKLGLFAEFGTDRWLEADVGVNLVNGVFTAGVGADLLLLKERVRISVSAGTATLLFDATFDNAGSTGFYVELHPAAVRWPLTDWLVLELTPLTATVLVPGMGDPVLKRLEYRTMLGLEVTL